MSDLNAVWDRARVIQVIETTLTRRGKGIDEVDPVRVVTQYWALDGALLAEVDPWDPPPDTEQRGE